jgi:hypothetical protein
VTAGLVVYSTVDSAFRNGALALGVTAALALAWIALGHDRDLDREQDPIRVATLGRWATLKSWWAFVQGGTWAGGPLRRQAPVAETLDDERWATATVGASAGAGSGSAADPAAATLQTPR